MEQACTDAGGPTAAEAPQGLRRLLRRLAEDMRESFGRPAMNRRILHRLATLNEADLSRLGLTRADVRDAALRESEDVAAFLNARRTLRR